MVALFDLIKRHSIAAAWIFSLVAGILLSQAPVNIKIGVSSLFMNSAYKPFAALSSSYHLLKDRRTENLRLKEELISTRLKLEAFKEAERENERLRKAFGFSQKLNYINLLVCVIGRGTPRMPSSIVVGAGTNNSIIVGLPVIDESGVVGKVAAVYEKTSIIQLLNDPNFKISAVNGRSRIQGIVSATPEGRLLMENVPISADIRHGDPIVSSGLGGVFPKGLMIGRVERVVVPQSGLFKGIDISSSARLSTLEEVFILFPGVEGWTESSGIEEEEIAE